jgi:hypothetical protein
MVSPQRLCVCSETPKWRCKSPQLEVCIVRQELVSGVYLENAFHVVKDILQAKDDLQIRIGSYSEDVLGGVVCYVMYIV